MPEVSRQHAQRDERLSELKVLGNGRDLRQQRAVNMEYPLGLPLVPEV